MKVLFATGNEAKIKRYGTILRANGINVVTPSELGLKIDVVEDGKTPEENALIKAKAYYYASGIMTFALDDGLYLDGVPSNIQPGNNVRRVNGRRLDDLEMIEYYVSLVNDYGKKGILNGYFLKGVAIVGNGFEKTFQYKCLRSFRNKASNIINKGYPLASIQYIEEFDKFKSELNNEEESVISNNEDAPLVKFLVDAFKEI